MRRPLLLVAIAATCLLPACISPGCFLKPTGAYDAGALAGAPDYAQPSSWAALPSVDENADLTPEGVQDAQAQALADVFFVHPTVWFDRERWNDTLDDPRSRVMVDEVILSSQASAFNGCCRVFAPRYRQTTLGAFYAEDIEQARASFEVAYSDIERAFDHFLANHNASRPFILAGHSQGSMHLMRLLERVAADDALRARFVAAYIPGFSHPVSRYETSYPQLAPCVEPEQTGCIAAWDTYREGAATTGNDPLVFWKGDTIVPIDDSAPRQCTNPVTWSGGDAPSKREAHLGAVLPRNVGEPVEFTKLVFSSDPIAVDVQGLEDPRAGMVSVRCEDGFLRAPDLGPLEYPVQETEAGNYHLLDYELFWMDVRANAIARVKAWEAKNASAPVTTPAAP